MAHTGTPTPTPALLGFARALDAALDKVTGAEPMFLSVDQQQELLVTLHRCEQRIGGLRMRTLAASDPVAGETGDRDAAAWLARQVHDTYPTQSSDLHLGEALARRWQHLEGALGRGAVSVAQARVIARTLDQLPDHVGAEITGQAEDRLVTEAAGLTPKELRVLGRRILDLVAPEIAEAEEAKRLAAEEEHAWKATRLTTRANGDGTTSVFARIPDAVADRLHTYLDALTSPRHTATGEAHHPLGVPGIQDGDRIPMDQKRGQAFCALLERIDPATLPDHGGDATTVMVTIDLDTLRADLDDLFGEQGQQAGNARTARSAGAGTTGPTRRSGTKVAQAGPTTRLTAEEVRRLACTAGIVPVVLGGKGEILDLVRKRRLFTPSQRKAMAVRDQRCRAEGCTIPAAWCEAHHLTPWSHCGHTDLDTGVLLCAWHHHRIHDPHYTAEKLPTGDLRYHRRT